MRLILWISIDKDIFTSLISSLVNTIDICKISGGPWYYHVCDFKVNLRLDFPYKDSFEHSTPFNATRLKMDRSANQHYKYIFKIISICKL